MAPGRQSVVILGATGSIGASALDVIERHPDHFNVLALTAHRDVDRLLELAQRAKPQEVVIGDATLEGALRAGLRARGLAIAARSGAQALADVAARADAQIVIAAIVGAAGLLPSLAAARTGKRLLLANKEAVVCAGGLLLRAVAASGGELLPVDSEHNAIHQCLAGARQGEHGGAHVGRNVTRLILTASGGPFRTRADLRDITPEQAIAHPNWMMGRKISVDCATLMNKGLEVIEASWLFGFAPERIDVVIHPQSVIHSMVEFNDGSIMAQLGSPDMRTPIAYALGFPERIASGSAPLDFLRLAPLTFEAPDRKRFPCLTLAYDALAAGTGVTATLNAANEIAVEAFLERRLAFALIPAAIDATLQQFAPGEPNAIEDIIAIDGEARRHARECVVRLAN